MAGGLPAPASLDAIGSLSGETVTIAGSIFSALCGIVFHLLFPIFY